MKEGKIIETKFTKKSLRNFANIKKQILQGQKNGDVEQQIDENKYISERRDSEGVLIESRYSLSRNSTVYIITSLIIFVVFAIFVYLLLSSSGNYLSAWYLSIMGGVFLLYLFSFPVKIIVKNSIVELHGVLDVTPIPIKNIKRIYKIDRYRVKHVIPLAGSFGFGGFFGYFFDYKKLKVLTFFCGALESLVVIEDMFHDKYILNVPQRDRFIEQVRSEIKTE